jgi:hypothetical protein
MASDPLATGRRVLAAIRSNIRHILQMIQAAGKDEKQQLASELKKARQQEREARKYV